MKAFFLVLALAVAAVSSVPLEIPTSESEAEQRFIVGNIVAKAVESISETIQDIGLDPLNIQETDLSYAYSPPDFFNARLWITNLLFTGASNIVINRADYNVILSRVRVDFSLPELALAIEDSGLDMTVLGNRFTTQVSGKVSIVEPRISLEMNIRLGPISGITIRTVKSNLTLRGIISNMNLSLMGFDISQSLNNFLGVKIPTDIAAHRLQVNSMLDNILVDIINNFL